MCKQTDLEKRLGRKNTNTIRLSDLKKKATAVLYIFDKKGLGYQDIQDFFVKKSNISHLMYRYTVRH